MKARASARMPALAVPQTDAEADSLLKEYGERCNALLRVKAGLDDALAKVKAQFEGLAKPDQQALNTLYAQLSAWGAAHRDRLTEGGKSKTVHLPAGAVGWRARPPSVKWAKGFKVEDVIAAIKQAGMRRFLRLKEEPNKERMLEEPDAAKLIEGVVVGSAGEDFFVSPFGAELAEPK